MDKYSLPKSTIINGIECTFDADFRNIIQIMTILSDPDLLESEQILIALSFFYDTDDYKADLTTAQIEMFSFISGPDGLDETPGKISDKPLYDWDQDFAIIVAPVNRIIGTDVRGLEYLHWWTFLSAFLEIGECTFNTFISIRDKLNKGIKLDKTEERIFKENRNKILLKRKVDSTTQALMDEILGREV